MGHSDSDYCCKCNDLGAGNQAEGAGRVLELVALNRVHLIERNRNIPGLCWSWIAFNLNRIEGSPL
jgi:hypothetical protein